MKSTVIFLLILLLSSCQKEDISKPNIVIILADDLGYGDLGVYNDESKISTPSIDRLAAEGMRFTDAHSPSSVCSPTRYGLLTGRYGWRSELKSSVLWPWDKPLIEANRFTLPKMLKNQDYTTACIGKWHLGWQWPSIRGTAFMNDTITIGDYGFNGRNELWKNVDFSKSLGGGPNSIGFDYYFGDDVPNFPPYVFIENDKLTQIPNAMKPDTMFGHPGPMVGSWKLQNVMPILTEKAMDYILNQTGTDEPFFLYLSLTAPHTPIAPMISFEGTSGAGAYGDFVQVVDWTVERIIWALKEYGAYQNTLIIFTSDNGSPQRDGTNMSGPIGSVKKYGHDPSRPWKGMKGDIWEGGHRVPFIASWPGKIPNNSISEQIISLTDIISTLANLLNISGQRGAMEDSYDFSSVLLGEDQGAPMRDHIIHHSANGTFAIRKAGWKLILGKDSGGFSNNLNIDGIPVDTKGQLYNINEDPTESENVYARYPEKVEGLTGLLNNYREKGRSRYKTCIFW